MNNELLFFLQTGVVSAAVLGALVLGREALVCCIAFLLVLANLFVVKQITLFGFQVTAADVYIIGAVLGFNLLQEYFGKKSAQKAIWTSFFISLVFVVMAQIHLHYLPNAYDVTNNAFAIVLGFLPRIIMASFVTHLVVQYFRLFFYGMLQRYFGTRYLVGRHIVVTSVEQIIDTVLFGFIGLYGIVHALTDIFVVSFIIKMIAILCTAPWLALSRRLAPAKVASTLSELQPSLPRYNPPTLKLRRITRDERSRGGCAITPSLRTRLRRTRRDERDNLSGRVPETENSTGGTDV